MDNEARPKRDDEMEAYDIITEATMELDSIAGMLLRDGDNMDAYAGRTLGTRLQHLSEVIGIACDNRGEESRSWAVLRRQLVGGDSRGKDE